MKAALAAVLLVMGATAQAAPLTIRSGETWIFTIERGQPANARKAAASASPARGEIKGTVQPLMGTTLTVTNNSATAYTFSARLIGGDGKPVDARTCILPAGGRPALENWPKKAGAVRVGDFKASTEEGRC